MKSVQDPLGGSVLSLTQRRSVTRLASHEKAFVKHLLVLAPIILLQLSLAFYRLDHQSFWTDEVASLLAAGPNESFFSKTIWLNGQGPLYFALLHIWLTIGETEFVVRSLASILGSVAVSLTYALGLRLGDRKFATISALLMATSPFLVWYSQETRYITLAIATSLLSMYAFHSAMFTNSFRAWAFYSMATITALFSFVPLAFLTLAQGLYMLSREWRRRLPKWIASQVGIYVVFGTWLSISYLGLSIDPAPSSSSLAIAVNPVRLETGTPRETTLGAILYTFFVFTSGFSVGPSVEELHISRDLPSLLGHLSTVLPLALFFGALFIFGLIQLYRRTHASGLLLLWLVIPILGVFAISALTDVAYNVRYACAAMPAYVFIFATGIVKLRSRALQLGILVAVLSFNAASLAQHYYNPRYAKADARRAARYLESVGDPRDVILLVGSSTAWGHYYKGYLPVVRWNRAGNSSRESVRKNVESLTNRHDRLWFIAIRPWETDPNGNVKAVLDETLQQDHYLPLPGVEIASYNHRSATPTAFIKVP